MVYKKRGLDIGNARGIRETLTLSMLPTVRPKLICLCNEKKQTMEVLFAQLRLLVKIVKLRWYKVTLKPTKVILQVNLKTYYQPIVSVYG